MNAIAVYHHPQECGSPYLTFISQETGEVVETVDIPEGYFDSGLKRTDIYTPVYSFTEQVNQSPKPTVDNVRLNCSFYPNPKRYVFKVTKVDNIKYDPKIIPTWTADVHVDACTHTTKWQYSTKRDSFRKQLQKAGFNMKPWTLTKRMKTPFMDFIKSVASSYKDYHLVNLIQIG